jgi:hypothetical protein
LEEEVFHVIESLAVDGLIGDEIAFIEEDIEFGVREFASARFGVSWLYKSTSV